MAHGIARWVGLGMVALFLGGCGGAGGSGAGEQASVEACIGVFDCEMPGHGYIQVTLSREQDGCYVGNVRLADDGTVYYEGGGTGVWYETANGFQIDDPEPFLVCTAPGSTPSTPQPSSGAGKCIGSAKSCFSYSGGSCDQKGCSLTFHVKYNGELEPKCGGSAKPCSSFDSSSSCKSQDGCYWQ